MERQKRNRRRAEKRRQSRIKKQELEIRIRELRKKFLQHLESRLWWQLFLTFMLPQLCSDTKGKKHQKLTLEDRQQIYAYKSWGLGIRAIAKILCRAPSTISRELKRNSPPKYFDQYSAAKYAQDRYQTRLCQPRRGRTRLKQRWIQSVVFEAIKGGLTPEQVSERLMMEHGVALSHEAIYNWIYEVERQLIPYLPRQGRKYRRNSKKRSRAKIQPAAPKLSIEKRPKAANERREFGHWEFDTIVSKQSKACLLVLLERVSRFFFVVKLPSCSADEASRAVIRLLKPLGKDWVKSLTCDNGPENWGHKAITQALNVPVYFCHPYCSSERGGVENRNGVLRRIFPKKTDFENISEEDIERAWQNIVNRPMRCLGYFTPNEIFNGTYTPLLKKAA